MRTPEEWLALVALACAVRGARDVRDVYEAGAEPGPPAWGPAASAWDAAPPRPPAWDAAPPPLPPAWDAAPLPRRRTLYRVRGGAGRARIAPGLLTFDAQEPDPRLRDPAPILIVRQLNVDAFLAGPPPPLAAPAGGGAPGPLAFGPAPPPPTSTPRPWWRATPPLQLAVRPRLGGGGAAETLAVGSSPLVARLHGPVAMGSGGVGYARLPDGRLAIGSGSIGFAQFDVLTLLNQL